jgi:hypothetical protein
MNGVADAPPLVPDDSLQRSEKAETEFQTIGEFEPSNA